MMGEVTGEVAGFLGYRAWTLVRFAGRALITSDAPVSLVAHEQSGSWMGVGVQNARLVLYPMTRKIGLVMRNPHDDRHSTDELIDKARSGALDDEVVGTQREEQLMNLWTARHAVTNIFHHPDDAQFVPVDFQEK